MKYRQVAILAIGHAATDINQGALPAMLPFFIAAYDLSYAAAAAIVFAANMTSSIVQPLFGHAADRFSKPWMLSLGLMMAGAGLALTGVSGSYAWVLLLAIVSGIGIAAYHPEAARLVNFAAGQRKGAAMSMFGVGGTLGFALGPLIGSAALLEWGLSGTLVLLVPVALMALVMMSQYKTFENLHKQRKQVRDHAQTPELKDNWGAFARLTITVIMRSILFYGLNTFIPIYWINTLQQSKASGALALTVFAGAGIAGNLLGGALADRIGKKKVILLGCAGLLPAVPALVFVDDPQLALLLLIPIGLALYGTYSPTVVLGQSYLPNRVGLSSGVTLGVAVAIGGGAAPLIGRIADVYGVWYSMASLAGLPLLLLAIALSLPSPGGSSGQDSTD
jgi:FSR family fosmidomycin resistance protein-like MFS transporter